MGDNTRPPAPALGRGARRKVLLFHIGDHKTGTTSVQAAFATGRVKFADHTVFYPARMDHNYLPGMFRQYFLTGEMGKGQPGRPGLAAMPAAIRDADSDFTLVSGEQFEGMRPELFQQVIDARFAGLADEIRVICYLRPHAGRILSEFTELTKVGFFSGTPEQYHHKALEEGKFLYAPRMRDWKNVFGDAFIIRPVIRSELASGSVVDDLIRSGFGEAPYELLPGADANEALCLEDLALLRHLQDRLKRRQRGPWLRLEIGWDIAATLGAHARPGGGTKIRLHKALAEAIGDSYGQDARALDTEFFGGRPLFRSALAESVDSALPEPQSHDVESHFSATELRGLTVMAETLDGMLDGPKGLMWREFLWRKRAASQPGPLEDPESGSENAAQTGGARNTAPAQT